MKKGAPTIQPPNKNYKKRYKFTIDNYCSKKDYENMQKSIMIYAYTDMQRR